MKKEKPWKRAVAIVDRCKRGYRLCCYNQQTETGGSEIVYFFEPSGHPVGRKSVENALKHGLLIPQNDGLFGAEFSQTFVPAP